MARSTHPTYSAADRYERRATKRRNPKLRRAGTRTAILALALSEA